MARKAKQQQAHGSARVVIQVRVWHVEGRRNERSASGAAAAEPIDRSAEGYGERRHARVRVMRVYMPRQLSDVAAAAAPAAAVAAVANANQRARRE